MAFLLAVCVVSGCAAGPRYARPADPVQTGYITPAPAGDQHISLGGAAPEQWWTLLRSPQIDHLVTQALQNN